MTDFDRDPAALAWARGKIQDYIDRLAGFEGQAASKGDEASVHCFRLVQSHVRSYFLGDGGCVIGAFDERRPRHLDAIQAASDGPSVEECAEADRRWPLEQEGD